MELITKFLVRQVSMANYNHLHSSSASIKKNARHNAVRFDSIENGQHVFNLTHHTIILFIKTPNFAAATGKLFFQSMDLQHSGIFKTKRKKHFLPTENRRFFNLQKSLISVCEQNDFLSFTNQDIFD